MSFIIRDWEVMIYVILINMFSIVPTVLSSIYLFNKIIFNNNNNLITIFNNNMNNIYYIPIL